MNYRHEVARKAIHLGSAVCPLIYGLTGREVSLLIGVPVTLLIIGMDVARRRHAGFGAWYDRWLGRLMRADEHRRLCGASYVMIAVVLCILLFPPPVAIAAMLFLSVSDALASLVGLRVGGPRWFGKSLAGSGAHFASAATIALLCLPAAPLAAVLGALAATIMEAAPLRLGGARLDDNLTAPLAGGAMMVLLGAR